MKTIYVIEITDEEGLVHYWTGLKPWIETEEEFWTTDINKARQMESRKKAQDWVHGCGATWSINGEVKEHQIG